MSDTPAFDAVAYDYDRQFTDTATGRAQRERVFHYLKPWLNQPLRILEVNCGTGADAVRLAQAGHQVLATDLSPEMVKMGRHKLAEHPSLQERLRFEPCSLTALDQISNAYPFFDLLWSNFGGLNCLSPEELKGFFLNATNCIQPDGHFALVIMGRFCWWESLYFLLKGEFRVAFRRWRRSPTLAQLDDTTQVTTWYYSPKDVARYGKLAKFESVLVKPIGIWLPPSYLDTFFAKRPTLFHWLKRVETGLNQAFFANFADHYLVVLKKQ